MRQLVVLSGKGGTGKTTLAACLARLAGRVVIADADVDAPDLALVLPGEDGPAEPFVAGRRAVIRPERCLVCGACEAVCRFGAVRTDGAGGALVAPRVDPLACEGCGACAQVCLADAVRFRDNLAGVWRVRRIPEGWLVRAALGVAQDNSGKLVTRVREEARRIAAAEGVDLILVDGPPGIGCPVHAALVGADDLLAVTEPTPAGEHDLQRLLRLAQHFAVPVHVVVNKWDLAPALTERLERLCADSGATVVGRIPFDPGVPRALAHARLPLDPPAAAATRAAVRAIAGRLGVGAAATADRVARAG